MMTIATQIAALQQDKSDIASAITSKGGTVTAGDGFDDFATDIASIPAGGGSVITATNKTGSAISEGDKVWINKNQTSYGDNFRHSGYATARYNFGGVISSDGTKFISTNTASDDYIRGYIINNISTGSYTLIESFMGNDGYVLTVSNSSIGRTTYDLYGNVNIKGYSGGWRNILIGETIEYTAASAGISGGCSVGISGTSDASTKFNLLSSDGTITSTISSLTGRTSTLPYSNNYVVGLSNNETLYWALSNSAWRAVSLNWTNMSGVISDVTTGSNNSTTMPSAYPIGRTSDNKFIIAQTANSCDASTNGLIIMEVKSSTRVDQVMSVSNPDLTKWFSSFENGAYFTMNHKNNVLTCAKRNSKEYGFFKYDPSTSTWETLHIKLPFESGEILMGEITISEDLSVCCMCTSTSYNSSSRGSFAKIVKLNDVIGYTLIPYSWSNMNEITLTGFAEESIANNSTGSVKTVLPEKISVSVTVDADNATINLE